jgi:electron transport complex protein RnfB
MRTPEPNLVNALDAVLPQTQCRECTYAGCRPYAEALARQEVTIDKCPPGGVKTLLALSQLLHLDATPYLAAVTAQTRPPSAAVIREEECIGCTKCIQACPVDAIVGSAKTMHTVLQQDCTGCGLCVEPCPVDCIDMVALPEPSYTPERARQQFDARKLRLNRILEEKQQRYREQTHDKTTQHAMILAALARKKAKE